MRVDNLLWERKDEPTPNGGVYSIAHYKNAKGQPIDKKEAVAAEIIEYDSDGQEIMRFYMAISKNS